MSFIFKWCKFQHSNFFKYFSYSHNVCKTPIKLGVTVLAQAPWCHSKTRWANFKSSSFKITYLFCHNLNLNFAFNLVTSFSRQKPLKLKNKKPGVFGIQSSKMLEIIWCQEPIVIGSYRCRLWSTRERKELLTHSQVLSRVSRTRSLWKACSQASAINNHCIQNILKVTERYTDLTPRSPTSQ